MCHLENESHKYNKIETNEKSLKTQLRWAVIMTQKSLNKKDPVIWAENIFKTSAKNCKRQLYYTC